MGFNNGGLGAVLYEVVFKRRLRSLAKSSPTARFFKGKVWLLVLPLVLMILIARLIYFGLGYHSFWATVIALSVTVGLVVFLRHDLLRDAFWGGLAMVVVSLSVFKLGIYLFPGVIESFWRLPRLSGILLWGIPLEDLVFYFVAGAFVAPLYEFIFVKQLVRLPRCG